jgi:DNA repair protein RadD
MVNNIQAFGKRDLLLIDECHLVSTKSGTMYETLIRELLQINPYLKVIGLTATPYRLGQGLITDSGIFTDICYDLTSIENFNRLIAEGFLSPLIPKATKTEIDVSSIAMSQGDYKQNDLQNACDKEKITYAALQELMEFSYNRLCGMIFATGVDHAEHIHEMLTTFFGQSSVTIHSRKTKEENKAALEAWKAGKVKWAVSMNALTTGVDNPMVDVIGMLRPTASLVLWVQMLGRGTRPSPATGKRNCLVLDFAGNTKRLGPINDPVIPKKKGKGTGEVPVKICEQCGCYNHCSVRFCDNCGAEFLFRTKFKEKAGSEELLASGVPQVEYFDITYVIHNKYEKEGAKPMIRADYFCGMQKFSEWICLEHEGFAKKKAHDWWRQRHTTEPPLTTDEALQYVSQLRAPKRLRVWVNKRYPEILGYEY